MLRRTMILGSFALLCGFAMTAAAAERPNVVLIMLDDFGYECVAANGSTSYRTPNLDRLAAGGVRGTHCHVQPLCTPTRVQLMTGQYNVRNYTHFGHLDPGQTTFGHLFKRAGYTTCIAGKWQLGREMSLPAHFGFDHACLWQLTRRPPRYANPGLEIDGREIDYTGGEYGPDIVNQYARDFIAAHRGEPFFLYYPMMLTHGPFQPTPDSKDWDPKLSGEKRGNNNANFADMVTYADKLIGQLVTTLDEQGLRDNTLLLIVGDNGTGRGLTSKLGDRTVKGGKGGTLDTGTHVPLVANWPGKIPAGRVLDDLVDSTDFLPTICDAAGIALAADHPFDGRSFLPQLRGEKGNPREWIYVWYGRSGGARAQFEYAFDKQYKLYRDGEMYDLAHDPEEERPLNANALSAEAQTARAKFKQALDQYASARPEQIAAQAQPKGKNGD